MVSNSSLNKISSTSSGNISDVQVKLLSSFQPWPVIGGRTGFATFAFFQIEVIQSGRLTWGNKTHLHGGRVDMYTVLLWFWYF